MAEGDPTVSAYAIAAITVTQVYACHSPYFSWRRRFLGWSRWWA